MPYITGSAADMDAVKTALVNACTGDGWTEQTDFEGKTVLSKSGIYVRVEAFADIGDGNPGFNLLGRTSLDGGDAPGVVSMRSIGDLPYPIIFPVTYHIFTFANNEVYLVINYTEKYQWIAFGQSDQNGLPGTGNWVAATSGSGFSDRDDEGIWISESGGGGAFSWRKVTTGALFWATEYEASSSRNGWVHNGLDSSYPWALGEGGNTAGPVGIKYLTELVKTQPNAFNSESVLMPVRAYKKRSENKISQVLEIENARHIRVDNYNNEQIITLGTDEWMIFPYYKKNINNRNGGEHVDHTGTFGWAIKKES